MVMIRMSLRVNVSAYTGVELYKGCQEERRQTVTYLCFVKRTMSCAMTGKNNQNESVW